MVARQTILFLGALFLFILIIGMLFTNSRSSMLEGVENQDEAPDSSGNMANQSTMNETE